MLRIALIIQYHQHPQTHKWHSQLLQFRQLIECIVWNDAELVVIQVPASDEWMNTQNRASWQLTDLATMFVLTRPPCCASHQLSNTTSTLKQH
jgi:hypothetical protein